MAPKTKHRIVTWDTADDVTSTLRSRWSPNCVKVHAGRFGSSRCQARTSAGSSLPWGGGHPQT